ncbi:MAG: SpoIIE family protein phosphatase [Candidatus Riflebacteria bacterium]|nr:SpoIIE family protein phosphatase [Candidatus Riflebacteria bacterium]
MHYLIIVSGDRPLIAVRLTDAPITLGSGAQSDVVVPSVDLSPVHASVRPDGNRYVVTDQESATGVCVGGSRVLEHVLGDGDLCELGSQTRLLYLERFDEAALAALAPASAAAGGPGRGAPRPRRPVSLPESVEELQTLIQVGARIASSLDLDDVLNTLLDRALQLMGGDRGFVMLVENGTLVPMICRNMERDQLGETGTFSHTFAHAVVEQGNTITATNIMDLPQYRSRSVIAHDIGAIMCAPLKLGESVFGCLYVDVKKATPSFSGSRAPFFTALANQAAIAIHNARLTRRLNENQAALAKTRDLLGFEHAAFLLWTPDAGALQVRAATGPPLADPVCPWLGPVNASAMVASSTKQPVVVDGSSGDPRLRALLSERYGIVQLTCVPLLSGNGCLGVLALVDTRPGRVALASDLDLLASLAGLAAVSIERFRVLQERQAQEKLNRELEDARQVQELLLPSQLEGLDRFDISSKYAQANRVGGDYYDFIPVGDRLLGVVLGDVSGHDIAAAMLMAMGRNVIRLLYGKGDPVLTTDPEVHPGAVLARANDLLAAEIPSDRFVTMVAAVLDQSSMTLRWANAGGPYPMLLKAGSSAVRSLTSGGLPLGLVPGQEYPEETTRLATGDLVVVYTDGLEEARAPSGELFGHERIEALLVEHRYQDSAQLVETIYSRALEFTGQHRLQDDFTLVIIRAR